MGQHIIPGNPPVEVTLRRSPRARRISLRVSGLDGRVTLTLPHGVAEREALNFAHTKGDWLRAQLDNRPDDVAVQPGADIPVEGQIRRIAIGSGRRVILTDETLFVPDSADTASRLRSWLRTRARDHLAAASDHYAAQLGASYSRLTLRDTRSRWGSCSHKGGLMYSWRLILAPPDVLDYVAAHEVTHLLEMNHSPAFWSVVARLKPAYEEPRRWLRDNGSGLHRYRFDD